MKLIEKAYTINKSNLNEAWFITDDVFYADTVGKAKQLVFQEHDFKYGDITDRFGDKITFITLKVKRAPIYDKYLVDGEIKTKLQIERYNHEKKRIENLNAIYSLNPNSFAYIMKNGVYYRDNYRGYVHNQEYAGVYNIKEAVDYAIRCSELTIILIDPIKHNEKINSHIELLKSHLINP